MALGSIYSVLFTARGSSFLYLSQPLSQLPHPPHTPISPPAPTPSNDTKPFPKRNQQVTMCSSESQLLEYVAPEQLITSLGGKDTFDATKVQY
jgi:hypothetical protein